MDACKGTRTLKPWFLAEPAGLLAIHCCIPNCSAGDAKLPLNLTDDPIIYRDRITFSPGAC